MRKKRAIIKIDEEKCTGCGACVPGCAEGALAIVDGKARLMGEVLCDGLGACMGTCPSDALRIVEEEAEVFDEEKVKKLIEQKARACAEAKKGSNEHFGGCPSAQAMSTVKERGKTRADSTDAIESELTHWPVKLQLLNPHSSFLKDADLLLLADCAAVAFPELHRKLLKDRVVAIVCPKFENLDEHIERLGEILETAKPRTLTIAHMEVPCCHGLYYAVLKAYEEHPGNIQITRLVLGRDGHVTREEKVRESIIEAQV
jgi:Fe-S-cluster-containing hydrogenase component 2